jgi:hypothetical protein
MQWRLAEQAAAETASGFKQEQAYTSMSKPNWLGKEFQIHPCPGISPCRCATARPIP